MVKGNKLGRFVRLSGYDVVKKRGNGGWKDVSLASGKTGLSRQMIYNLLADFPDPTSKTKPKYVVKLGDSEGYASAGSST